MRVAHLIHGLGIGGAQRVIASIVRRGNEKEFRHFVYAARDGDLRRDIENAGARVRVIERTFPKFDPSWVVSLRRQLGRDRIDLVHGHLFGDSFHGYLAASSRDLLPVVLTVHNTSESMTALQKAGYSWLFRRKTRIAACSESVRSDLLEHLAPSSAQIQVIRNGISSNHREPTPDKKRLLKAELGFRPDEFVIAAFGRLEEQKGYKYLIESYARLFRKDRDKRLKLALFGEGSLRNELEHQVKESGLPEGQVGLFGFVPNVTEILTVVDVVAFSSLYEGLSIALLESMRAGKCIVGTDIPGISEAVRDSQEAILVPRKNVDALRAALARVTSNRALRASLGKSAETRFLNLFTEDEMCRQYEALYRSAVRNPAIPQGN